MNTYIAIYKPNAKTQRVICIERSILDMQAALYDTCATEVSADIATETEHIRVGQLIRYGLTMNEALDIVVGPGAGLRQQRKASKWLAAVHIEVYPSIAMQDAPLPQ